jgi:hypothetical protein
MFNVILPNRSYGVMMDLQGIICLNYLCYLEWNPDPMYHLIRKITSIASMASKIHFLSFSDIDYDSAGPWLLPAD